MQTVVIIPEQEWRQLLADVQRLQAQVTQPAAPAGTDDILNVRQAAARLGMRPDGLRKARRAGRVKGIRLNEKEWGFRESELTRYQNRYNRAWPATA